MAGPGGDSDLINFDIIETHKENIQSLPGGRSAKQLASILTPLPSGKAGAGGTKSFGAVPTLDETRTLNDAIRQEYEVELQAIADSDDPLDIYDRYVKWTLNAYPSAQATPQSQLLPLLERATKAFLTSSHYKNDPRYLKLWLHYIRLFSDSPRETFAFLARHNIGDGLGLFYEEFASWLESADRWLQAEEVYQLGIQREARPTERLVRKYNQFQQRYSARTQTANEPSSPALPTVRAALAAKIDPFAPAPRGEDPQSQPQQQSGSAASRSGKPKMAIFSDADGTASGPAVAATSKGWDSIGSMKDRKKENAVEPRPWAGETLKAGKKTGTAPKMEIFKDPSSRDKNESHSKRHAAQSNSRSSSQASNVVNPRTGRSERAFVHMDAVYPPDSKEEFSFEELRAASRGWSHRDWNQTQPSSNAKEPLAESMDNLSITDTRDSPSKPAKSTAPEDVENLSQSFQEEESNNDTTVSTSLHDVSTQSMVGMPEPVQSSQSNSQPARAKEKKLKIREVKQETQTVKTRLESPTRKKLRRKNTAAAEPTMTFHSKAATNDIYDMFNQPLPKPEVARDETLSGDDGEFTEGDLDDGYSTAGDGESTGTGRVSVTGSEYGDDSLSSLRHNSQPQTDPESVSPWSDFTASKHLPSASLEKSGAKKSSKEARRTKTPYKPKRVFNDDMTENMESSSQNLTQTFGFGEFDTQAIAAIANADFEDMDTKAIALLAGDVDEAEDESEVEGLPEERDVAEPSDSDPKSQQPHQVECDELSTGLNEDIVSTPVDKEFAESYEVHNSPRFVPIPPEDYEPTPVRPYRDPTAMANSKLPFMTPIVERTESSLAPSTIFQDPDYFSSKTPSRSAKEQFDSPTKLTLDNLLMSSPPQPSESPSNSVKRKISKTTLSNDEISSCSPRKKTVGSQPLMDDQSLARSTASDNRPILKPAKIHKGPVVLDLQCNPCDEAVRQQILTTVHPPLSSYPGYYDHSSHTSGQYAVLKSYAEKISKTKTKGSPKKSQGDKAVNKAVPPVLKLKGTTQVYAVKRQLGEGAFAPVYLVESYNPTETVDDDEDKENIGPGSSRSTGRGELEALKTEAPPGTLVWEFHILRLLRQRLGPASRTMESIVLAHECHLYRDEAYLVLTYSPQGTLLDLVNLARNENVKAGKMAEGLDETLAMFFSVELLRIMEDLHRIGILHGDLKGDNCLVRFDPEVELQGSFDAEGELGWKAKGLTLIDFGRGIDVRMFKPQAQFIADWASSPQDCAEIRECRPWKYQIDYHGAAGIIHSLLFGKYIETVPATGGGLGQMKEWKLKDSLKRYWEKELWHDVFAVLLNPGSAADGEAMPIQNNLKAIRGRMQDWLREEGERGGRDLRGSLRKMERLILAR